MGKIAKFLANEIDRASEYVAMAKAVLEVPYELCEDNCITISDELDEEDVETIQILKNEIPRMNDRISDIKEIADKIKNRDFNLIAK